jgi:hypothetical protein
VVDEYGDDAWMSEKRDWPEVGVKGRSCDTKLAGDVGRMWLYFSVIRLCIMRARSWSDMLSALISWMRSRRWAMPSSAGSNSAMVLAFWLGVLEGRWSEIGDGADERDESTSR